MFMLSMKSCSVVLVVSCFALLLLLFFVCFPRVDTILNALECLAMLALLQSDVRIALCETFLMPNGERVAAMK